MALFLFYKDLLEHFLGSSLENIKKTRFVISGQLAHEFLREVRRGAFPKHELLPEGE
jgi:hypothetical protein